jgi:hypothetical protein
MYTPHAVHRMLNGAMRRTLYWVRKGKHVNPQGELDDGQHMCLRCHCRPVNDTRTYLIILRGFPPRNFRRIEIRGVVFLRVVGVSGCYEQQAIFQGIISSLTRLFAQFWKGVRNHTGRKPHTFKTFRSAMATAQDHWIKGRIA